MKFSPRRLGFIAAGLLIGIMLGTSISVAFAQAVTETATFDVGSFVGYVCSNQPVVIWLLKAACLVLPASILSGAAGLWKNPPGWFKIVQSMLHLASGDPISAVKAAPTPTPAAVGSLMALFLLASCSTTQQAAISADITAAQAKAAVIKIDVDQLASSSLPVVCTALSLANTGFSLLVRDANDAAIEQGVYNGMIAPGAPCEPGATITNAAQLVPKVLVAVDQIRAAVKG